ncbi:Calx-beta domain-containing protein [Bernardetia sp. OM2101]|uniref:Calx-beta domain-containing protein n=1 Tax=Bernardetia sp. OM2101 TaxID=3344876 RepID=UPI0035CF209E
MYKNYIIGILLSFLFLINQNAYSQNWTCASNDKHQELLSDPQYRATFEKMQSDIRRRIDEKMANAATHRTEATVYNIPVVVHVIHTGGGIGTIYNPTVANINAMLGKINTDFRNTTFGADVEINFVLAQRDPNCNATTGINRVDGSGLTNYTANGVGTGGAADADVKALSIWSNTDYYNIWVVNKIDGADGTSGTFTAGYAYFPGASPSVDGTVILATQTNGTSTTMTHEFGHAFALHHTFHKAETGDDSSNDTDCPLNTDCTTQGDLICDTAPQADDPFQCTTNNCGSTDVLTNYMSYSNCSDRFTPNQVTRMRTALETQRGGLITSLGGTAPITAPTTACTPTNTGNHSAMGVTRFILNNLNLSSQSSQFEGTNYVNRVCGQGTTLNAGSSHTMTVETSINSHNVKVYVDYNNNGDFTDVGEEIASGTTVDVAGTETFTTTYNVPNSGVLFNQPLRLRVVAASQFDGGTATSCEVFRGQAEDYSITIQSVATPTVNLSVSTNAGSEAGTTAVTVTATASSAVSGAQTVDLGVSGTGIAASDYTLSGTTINIADGATTGTITFTVVDDADVEGTETATLTISNPSSGMTLGATTTQDVVITDNDVLPTVNLSVSTNAGSEAGTTAVTVTATASSAVSGAQTVDLDISGTGIAASDYTLSGTTINIANGATTGTVTFTVVDDADVEGTETATLTISNPSSGMTLGATTTQDVVITDNDVLPTVNLSVSTNAGSEAGTTAVTVTATASSAVSGAQTVDLDISGTGIAASDYTLSGTTINIANGATTGTVTFTVVDDADVEGTETATLTISNPSAGMTLGATTTQDVVITDNDVLPTVNLSVSTNAGSEAGTTVVTVTATASSAVSGAQTVDLGVLGTGIAASDYTLSGTTINIADGATTGTVTFTVVDDADVEGTETATLTISNPSSGMTLGATTTQDVVITDNDVLPTVNLSVSTNAGSEAGTTAVTVTATASSAVSGAQTVDLGVSGTGIAASDYTLSGTTINIANGATTGTVTFTVVDDADVEGTETVTLTISNPSAGMTLGATTTQDVVITDNDVLPTVNLSVSTNAGSEAGTTAVTVTATASSAVSGAQTVDLGVSGTGIAASDYTLSGTTINIANGATTGTVTFTVVDDADVEGTETATLTISNPSAGMTLGATTTQDVVITDNDAATGNITNIDQSTFYSTIQDAVDDANDGETLKILVNDTYDEDVTITNKSLTFTSDATDYTQITVTQIIFNGVGKTLSISTHMGISELLNMQEGNVVVTAGSDFALHSTISGTAMVINNGTNTVNGNVIAERYLPSVSDLASGYDAQGYHMFSSPFSDAAISQFGDDMNLVLNTAYNTATEPTYTNPFPTFYEYDETSAGTPSPSGIFNAFTIGYKVPTTVNLGVGKGYEANIATGVTVDLNGTLNNGDISIPITHQGLSYANEGFNLIGNPYPSPINWTTLIGLAGNNALVNDAVYIDIPTSQYGATYATFINGASVNGGKADIAPFQGFFVQAIGAGNLNVTNAVRPTTYTDSRFYKTNGEEGEQGLKEGLIKLAIEQNGKLDETAIYFESGATQKFDGKFDALKIHKINGSTPTLYSYNEGIEENGQNTYFSINGLKEFNEDMILPLAMNIVKSGKHKIVVREIKYFHSLSNVYLYDSLTETLHDLKANPEYEFVAQASKEVKRFVILFKTDKNFTQKDYVVAYPNPTPNQFSYSLKNDREGVHTIRLFDATGKLILERTQDKQGAFLEGTINLEKEASGLYLLQISDSKNTTNVRIVKE